MVLIFWSCAEGNDGLYPLRHIFLLIPFKLMLFILRRGIAFEKIFVYWPLPLPGPINAIKKIPGNRILKIKKFGYILICKSIKLLILLLKFKPPLQFFPNFLHFIWILEKLSTLQVSTNALLFCLHNLKGPLLSSIIF